jgi:hypothetical protein
MAQPLHLAVQQGGPPATKMVIAASYHLLPLFPVSPSLRVDDGPCRPGAGQEHPSPCLPVCPAMWAEGQASRLAGTHLSSIPASSPFSSEAPSWAGIVQDVVCTSFPPLSAVTRCKFLILHERCVATGLRARITTRHHVGSQEVIISCCLIVSTVAALTPASKCDR